MNKGITKTNILLNIELETQKTWNTLTDIQDDWKKTATKYTCKITYFGKCYVFNYWMGSAHTKAPTIKDILYSFLMDDVSSLTFSDFCHEFGYNIDSIKALKTYQECEDQTKNFYRLFDEEEREILKELLEDY